MAGTIYEQIALVDSSAVIALFDPREQFHAQARQFFQDNPYNLLWATLNETGHELFTRVRYMHGLPEALERYDFLRESQFRQLAFETEDELEARRSLQKYSSHTLSFHDALCAAVMNRFGIYRVFSFDSDFYAWGFEVLPGSVV